MKDGLKFQSSVFRSQAEGDHNLYAFCEVCGRLTKDPKLLSSKKGVPGVTFNLVFHNDSFMKITVWNHAKLNQEALYYTAVNLVKGDTVVVHGTVTFTPKCKNPDPKKLLEDWWYDMTPNLISARQEEILFVKQLMASPAINKMLESDEADAMESADDYSDEYEYADNSDYEYDGELTI